MNILIPYLFLTTILIWFLIGSIFSNKINKKYISIYIWFILAFILSRYIPSSFVYNNDIFSIISYSIFWIFAYSIISNKEEIYFSKKQDIINNDINIDNNIKSFKDKIKYEISNINIAESLLLLTVFSVNIIYYISYYTFNISFFENIPVMNFILILLWNTVLLSLYIALSKNNTFQNIIISLISLILGIIIILIFTFSWIGSFFIPNIEQIIKSFLWFFTLFFIIYKFNEWKLNNTYFFVWLIISYIVFSLI